jgi:hypothetical protein
MKGEKAKLVDLTSEMKLVNWLKPEPDLRGNISTSAWNVSTRIHGHRKTALDLIYCF